MAIQYTWSFPFFDVIPSEDGLTNVVKIIHWRYDAVDGDYKATSYGTVSLGAPNPTNFIPYDQITEQWAINAVSASVDVPVLEETMAKTIEDEKNPPIVPMPPPFQQI